MLTLPKSPALNAIAELLYQADQATRSQNPCKPSRLQRFSTTISANGLSSSHSSTFYSSSSESITKPHACPVTPQMSKHTKVLLLQYLDQNISSAAQFFDVTNFPLPVDDKGHALDAFLEATGMTHTNEWSLGDKVANHLLSTIRNQDRRNTACEAELKVEHHLSLILSITSPPHSQIRHLERAKQLCKKRSGKTFQLLERAEQHYANSVSFPSSPPSPLSPATRFHNHLRSRTSSSSLSSRHSTISSVSSKSLATPPILTSNSDDSTDSLPYGSFSVTPPARQSLRYIHSKSARPRIVPFFWTVRSAKVVPQTPSPPLEPEEGLPTICRTPVFENPSEYKEFIPRRMEPEKMVRVPSRFSSTTTPRRPSPPCKTTSATPTPVTRVSSNAGMNSILAEVEKASKFRMHSTCSKCLREGLDYPKCPRCNETWCSRECRVGGGKHSCGSPSVPVRPRV
ncbi:hypothetical protein BDM02DRAFT_415386 [Thelephora ganbajun]|uniref:Uncharacterized protein n=1 Tax=Thelephora ganbajun TaxID=370292 RepID=A0ACB6Z8N1_THEGA|nr:hypothetical protein BDM02DRAFT_415386 [Thelephora ganbajun]